MLFAGGQGLLGLGLVVWGQLLLLLGNKGERNSGGLLGSGRKGRGGPHLPHGRPSPGRSSWLDPV